MGKDTRRVFFIMILRPVHGWTRVGRAYGSRNAAREWMPFVRGAWRGLRAKVAQCTLRWVNGQLDESSRRTLDEKFNMDAPNAEVHGRAVARTVQPLVGHSESGAE